MPRNALIFYSLAALIVVALALNIRYDESGFINYYNKNYADAVPVLMESVDFGDGYAAVLIGKFHETRRQFELASKWHLKAAKLGEFRAIVWFLQTAIRRPNSAQNHVVSRRCAPVLRILNRAVAAGDATLMLHWLAALTVIVAVPA